MRTLILAASLLLASTSAHSQERPADVQVLEGSAATCTASPAASGSVVVSCPGSVRVVRPNLPVRYYYDVYRWDGSRYVPQFVLPGSTPVIVPDPATRDRALQEAVAAVQALRK